MTNTLTAGGFTYFKRDLYAVEIATEEGRVISRYFETLRGARAWAKWCSKKWTTRILRGGMGGEVVTISRPTDNRS